MDTYKDIISENPSLEVWKLLRSFLDVAYTSERIRSIHGLSDKKQRSNIIKQATQIGYCIRQAQEYFLASSQVDLPTRPLLLYYGAASLSTALVLLKQSGDYSLDALRKHQKHLHHGLDFQRELPHRDYLSSGVEQFFGSIKCRCHTENGIPWGLFGLFYQSLAPCHFAFQVEMYDAGKSTYLRGHRTCKCAEMLELNAIVNKTLNMLDLLKFLPDMYFAMRDIGIQTYLCRGSMKGTVTRHYKKDEHGKEQLEKAIEDTDFFIDDIDEPDKQHLVSFYSAMNPDIKVVADLGRNVHLKHAVERVPDAELTCYFPDIVDAITGAQFYVLKPETYLHEPAAYYILTYCLGMLSRYYPDLWIHVIDRNVRTAEFTDSLLNITHRKFPNLILDQMTSMKHHVHI